MNEIDTIISGKGLEKSRKYLKCNGIVAVPFDMGARFCHEKKTSNEHNFLGRLDWTHLKQNKTKQ